MEFPRIREAISASMSMQAEIDSSFSNGFISAHMLFPNEIPNMSSYIFGKLWNALRKWGEFVTMVFSVFVLGRILYTILKWIFALWAMIGAHGLSLRILWFPFMEILQLIAYRRTHREQRKAENGNNSYNNDIEEPNEGTPIINDPYIALRHNLTQQPTAPNQ